MRFLNEGNIVFAEGDLSPEVEKQPIIITFLGRNTLGILSDAKKVFGQMHPILVITRDDEKLAVPEGLPTMPVAQFIVDPSLEYVVIANGGTAVQLLPAVKKLVENRVQFSAYDVQRDRTTLLMTTPAIPEKAECKESGEKNQEIIIFLSGNTEKILDDVGRYFGNNNSVLVLLREDEQLQSPAKLVSVSANSFMPDSKKTYTLIANGGTTSQLLPTIDKLLKAGIEFNAFDLQKDSLVQVW